MSVNVSPKIAQQLLQVMEQDLVLAQQLKALLQEEKSGLEQRQYPAYQRIIKEKTQVLVQLDQTDNERKQLMASMGFNADRDGFFEFLKHVPSAWREKYSRCWEQLSDTLGACARLNRVNGKILAHSQTAMERLMQVIRGTHNQPSIYRANGRRDMGANHRVLATA
ncbi:MAG: flagella synthesis protein FlgN [Pseudomonadota bacterium]